MITLTVSRTKRGNGCFSSLTDAVRALPDTGEAAVIFIEPGVYYEKAELQRPFVTVRGASPENTVLSFDDYAAQTMPDGSRRGTFRSYTLYVSGNDITLENLTVRNASAPRSKAEQAIALYADADRLAVRNCRLESFQDTLFTGPLPPEPIIPGGFTGPGEFAPRTAKRQYYENCYICGDIDFIFGSAAAWFESCEIASLASEAVDVHLREAPEEIFGYATAASTPEGADYGYVFQNCRFTGDCPPNSVYLGRPWRNYAKTVLLRCELGSHIRREGFHDWEKPDAHSTVFYAEYQNSGPGAHPDARAPFVRQLSDTEACRYTKELVLSGRDHWLP